MTLKEYQEKYGIRRIDFSEVHRSGLEEQYADDELICPYCEKKVELECEDYEDVVRGEPWQCPHCWKWFYTEGYFTLNTTCTPMEDIVLDHRRHIEGRYAHIDKCEEKGLDWDDGRYGNIEWETYAEYAKPLFENQKGE